MSPTLFFSWQADRPTKTGRNLIERALERAIGMLQDEIEVEEAVRELTVDRDTKGVPGSPPIVETIFAKIDAASMFMPDVTFVGTRSDGRPTPNPNVLIEYGWALKSLSHSRIICLMNTAYGEPSAESLPFDMRHLKHPITYCCPHDADDATRQSVRNDLAKDLAHAIRAIVAGQEFKAALPRPPALPIFPRCQPKDGPARFREPGEPLGVIDGFRGAIPDVRLRSGSAIWMRLFPTTDDGRRWNSAQLKEAAQHALPLYHDMTGFNYLRADDGWGICSVGEMANNTDSLTFVFETGEIWSIDSRRIDFIPKEHPYIPFNPREFTNALSRFTRVAKNLEVKVPLTLIVGMEGVKGRGLSTLSQIHGHSVSNVISYEGTHEIDAAPAEMLKPFFELVLQKLGLDAAVWLPQIAPS